MNLIIAAQPAHTTLAGQFILYIVFPLILALILGLGTFGLWITHKINDHSQGLALILQDVRPVQGESLRDIVIALTGKVEAIAEQPGNHQAPQQRRAPRPRPV